MGGRDISREGMQIDRLSLEDWRNYVQVVAEFSPTVNIIRGSNAQGKTNLLEAIQYLSRARSYRARGDKELISFQAETARIRGTVSARRMEFKLEALLRREGRRSLKVNDVPLRSGSGLANYLNTVFFAPEDLSLIRAGAAERRRFLDSILVQLQPQYSKYLTDYEKVRRHKVYILREGRSRADIFSLMREFNQQLCHLGTLIILQRAVLLERLKTEAAVYHAACSAGEQLELAYVTAKTIADPTAGYSAVYQGLERHMESHRQAEIDSGQCLCGPHRDDFSVWVNGLEARQFCSQGQVRTAALSLKLAEREVIRTERGEPPVLLLDDVLSELDESRQSFVLNCLGDGQVFITYCSESGLVRRPQGKVFQVVNGTILED